MRECLGSPAWHLGILDDVRCHTNAEITDYICLSKHRRIREVSDAQSSIWKMSSAHENLFTSFPDDVPTAPLVTISLAKLIAGDEREDERLFEASRSLGFFYLNMQGCSEGESLLKGSNDMFDLNESFYSLPLQERAKYDFAAEGMYFGYKGMGAEVIDGKGTKDKNEIYNVRVSLQIIAM